MAQRAEVSCKENEIVHIYVVDIVANTLYIDFLTFKQR